ncbi:metallophosphoesterase family protein [Halocalculus aciditolerans]|uniref:Phosphoesterase n=1 Tax=Halocalculus aciditolerans TaxID=1383812 RepID=A0A830FM77_9EURY|nr:metallophosphoesterase family protein [Halocalculus aciditolerans]GGL69614.1 DNA repair protein [Halocalculus aciditolerans]
MRIGVISDVHANLVALEAVLSDMPAVDELVCAGDVVGYNPWPAECVERVREEAAACVMGNHDRKVALGENYRANEMARAGIGLAQRALSAEQLEWLRALPEKTRAADGRVKIVHGHPADPDRYTYPELFGQDLLGDEDVLVMGHTHVQHHEVYDAGIALNPGSVGQPRDGDPRAAYAVVDLENMDVTEHRVDYDIDAVADAVSDAGLPKDTGERLRQGK